jgi:hypothetical protein
MDPIMRNVRSAMAAALNKTAVQVRNQAIREIRDTYRLNVEGTRVGVKANVFVAMRASRSSLKAVIRATGAPLGVAKFPHRQLRKGVKVTIRRGSSNVLRTTFVATMASGHVGVFERRGPKVMPTKGRYEALSIERQKIYEIFTVSAASMFGSRVISEKLLKHAAEIFPKILQNQVEFRSK